MGLILFTLTTWTTLSLTDSLLVLISRPLPQILTSLTTTSITTTATIAL